MATRRGLFARMPSAPMVMCGWRLPPEQPSRRAHYDRKKPCACFSSSPSPLSVSPSSTSTHLLLLWLSFFYDTHSREPFDILARVQEPVEGDEVEDRNIYIVCALSVFQDNKAQQLLAFKRWPLSLPLGFRPPPPALEYHWRYYTSYLLEITRLLATFLLLHSFVISSNKAR